ncbi:hypothetical protein OUZ56_024780 [Daphnia magna]|uniref:Uncharacterized protein n=1 Tax=Daphnia magna TaxID=35525 RepID=A0ABQ9ZI01_9CRUS|nr:hypothetical protein OUZ56_024780 [Daphnia magna]
MFFRIKCALQFLIPRIKLFNQLSSFLLRFLINVGEIPSVVPTNKVQDIDEQSGQLKTMEENIYEQVVALEVKSSFL